MWLIQSDRELAFSIRLNRRGHFVCIYQDGIPIFYRCSQCDEFFEFGLYLHETWAKNKMLLTSDGRLKEHLN